MREQCIRHWIFRYAENINYTNPLNRIFSNFSTSLSGFRFVRISGEKSRIRVVWRPNRTEMYANPKYIRTRVVQALVSVLKMQSFIPLNGWSGLHPVHWSNTLVDLYNVFYSTMK